MRFGRIVIRLSVLALLFLSMGAWLGLVNPVLGWMIVPLRGTIIVQWHLRVMCRVIGLEIEYRGARLPDSPFLLVANHVSYLDILVIGGLTPIGFMAKREVGSWPVIGHLARRGVSVFVERDSICDRVRALYRAQRVLRHESFCIFPEGTTTSGRRPSIERWHRGWSYLVRPGAAPAYVMSLHYEDHASMAWIDDQSLLPHLLTLLGRRSLSVQLRGERLDFQPQSSLAEISQLAHVALCALADPSQND